MLMLKRMMFKGKYKQLHNISLHSLPMWQMIEKGIGLFIRKGPFGYLVFLWHKQKFKTKMCFTETKYSLYSKNIRFTSTGFRR